MRLIKMAGLAAVAALAAMAFVSASAASANTNTALCTEHENPCGEEGEKKGKLVTEETFTAGVTVLKTSLLTVLCLSSSVETEADGPALANPLKLQGKNTTWSNCGSNSAHDNCEVNTLAEPLFDVLRTALDKGTAVALGAEVLVLCGEFLHCVYGGAEVTGFEVEGAGASEHSGNGMFTAEELEVPKVSGFLCPSVSKWTALYEPLEELHLVE